MIVKSDTHSVGKSTAPEEIKKRQKINWHKTFSCRLRSLIARNHAVTGTFSGYGHEDVTEVILRAERSKHPGIRLGEQLGRGHVDIIDLGEAGDPGTRLEHSQPLAGLNQFLLGKKTRARANQAHLIFQNIPKLRKLVELGAPQKFPEGCHGRGIGQVCGNISRSGSHGAKFDQGEGHFVPTDAGLAEKRGTRIKQTRDRHNEKQRTGQNKTHGGQHNVKKAQHSGRKSRKRGNRGYKAIFD